jgi:hypothetical protein
MVAIASLTQSSMLINFYKVIITPDKSKEIHFNKKNHSVFLAAAPALLLPSSKQQSPSNAPKPKRCSMKRTPIINLKNQP